MKEYMQIGCSKEERYLYKGNVIIFENIILYDIKVLYF